MTLNFQVYHELYRESAILIVKYIYMYFFDSHSLNSHTAVFLVVEN